MTHPWHHPALYAGVAEAGALAKLPEGLAPVPDGIPSFMVASTSRTVDGVDAEYWHSWLTSPVDFKGALQCAARMLAEGCYIIDMGAHDALTARAIATLTGNSGVQVVGAAASMRRGQPAGFWDAQRSQLEAQLRTAAARSPTAPQARRRTAGADAIIARLSTLLATAFGMQNVRPDDLLMQSSLGSDDVPTFIQLLNGAFRVQLPAPFIFDCGSMRAIADHLAGGSRGSAPSPAHQLLSH